MDPARAAEIQRDEELAATPEDTATIAAREWSKDLHTNLPGIVRSFDRTTQTVRVQLTIKRLWIDNDLGWLPLPELVDCPVQFMRYGNFVITGPVSEGDEGLVHFSERAIDNWWHAGGVQEPSEYRLHDLSDGCFSPGYSSKGRVPANIADDALEIRTLDGATVIRVTDSEIQMNGDASSKGVARLGDSTKLTLSPTDIQTLAAALLATGAFVPSGTPGTPIIPPIPPTPLTDGEITGSSSTVKAGD